MIRKYKKADLLTVIDIWYQSSTKAHPFLEEAFVQKVKKDLQEIYIPNTETWVYEVDNAVVGFISMLGNEIGGLFVFPTHMSNGIGTQLVNLVKEIHEELEVEVFKKNSIGRAFYEKYGFTTINEFFHEESNSDVIRLKYS